MLINLSKSMQIRILMVRIHLFSNSEGESFQEDLSLVKMKDQNNRAKKSKKGRDLKRKTANKIDRIYLYSSK